MKKKASSVIKWGVFILASIRLGMLWIPVEASGEEMDGPGKVRFAYNTLEEGELITANEKIEVQLRSDSLESEIEKIVYKIQPEHMAEENAVEGIIEGGEGSLTVECDFSGWIEAYAVDCSGKQGEKSKSKRIICENRTPNVDIFIDGDEIGWNIKPVSAYVKVEDLGITSGLQNIKCYLNEELVENKQYEQNENCSKMEDEILLSINSVLGGGIPITVEATDWAGNYYTNTKVVYIDEYNPYIEMKGIREGMISGQPVNLSVYVGDSNGVQSQCMKIWKTNAEGETKLYTDWDITHTERIDNGNIEGEKRKWALEIVEDGSYLIEVSVIDLAGHTQNKSQTFTIDQTNPIIKYVEQMKGKYIPYFLWNYDVSEMIQDFTSFRYQMTLNGNVYTPGTYVKEDGVNILQVIAIDAAGNRSMAEAVFNIDSSAPEIKIWNVENGQKFQEKMELNIEVAGIGDCLEEIEINSEKMLLAKESQVFTRVIEEPGEYNVSVKARDLAGNRAHRNLYFFVEKRSLTSTVSSPIKKILKQKKNDSDKRKMPVVPTSQDPKKIKDMDIEDGITGNRVIIIIVVALFGSLLLWRLIKYRKI